MTITRFSKLAKHFQGFLTNTLKPETTNAHTMCEVCVEPVAVEYDMTATVTLTPVSLMLGFWRIDVVVDIVNNTAETLQASTGASTFTGSLANSVNWSQSVVTLNPNGGTGQFVGTVTVSGSGTHTLTAIVGATDGTDNYTSNETSDSATTT